MEDLDYFGGVCAGLAADVEDLDGISVKRLADNFWMTLRRYHSDVIEPLLRMRDELAPKTRHLEGLSRNSEPYTSTC
jgi:hypothetical protein